MPHLRDRETIGRNGHPRSYATDHVAGCHCIRHINTGMCNSETGRVDQCPQFCTVRLEDHPLDFQTGIGKGFQMKCGL